MGFRSQLDHQMDLQLPVVDELPGITVMHVPQKNQSAPEQWCVASPARPSGSIGPPLAWGWLVVAPGWALFVLFVPVARWADAVLDGLVAVGTVLHHIGRCPHNVVAIRPPPGSQYPIG